VRFYNDLKFLRMRTFLFGSLAPGFTKTRSGRGRANCYRVGVLQLKSQNVPCQLEIWPWQPQA